MAGTFREISSLVIAGSAARSDFTGPDIQNTGYRGARFLLDQTASTEAVTLNVQGRVLGSTSAKYITLFSFASTANGVKTYRGLLFPGLSTSANTGATGYAKMRNDFLPPVWRVTTTGSGASANNKYSITVDLIF